MFRIAPEGVSCEQRSQAAEGSATYGRWRRQPGMPGRCRLKDDGSWWWKIGRAGAAGYLFCWQRCKIDRQNGEFKLRGSRNRDEGCKTELGAERGFAVVTWRTAIAIAHVSVGHRGGRHGKGHAGRIRRMRNGARGKYYEQDNRDDAGESIHKLMLACFRFMSSYRLSQPAVPAKLVFTTSTHYCTSGRSAICVSLSRGR